MVPPLEESEEGDRASFSRWEKRSVISNHFTELILEITKMDMLAARQDKERKIIYNGCLNF